MYGSLHEFDIRSLLEWIERGQYTGQLLIETTSAFPNQKQPFSNGAKPSFWLLFFSNGQLTYTINQNHLHLQRLQDYLRRYQVEATVEYLPKIENIPLPIHSFQTTGRVLPEYNYLWVLLEHQILTSEQAIQILEHIMHETLFDLLSLNQGYFIFERKTGLQPQLTTIEVTPTLRQIIRELQQWKQLYPYITSPEQCPLIIKTNELKQALTASAYRSLAVACQGQLSLRRIARYLNKNLLTISQALYPYIQRGWLQLLAEEELWAESSRHSSTIEQSPSSNQVVCISKEKQVNQQIKDFLKRQGYTTTIIDDPLSALSLVARSQPCLIFCALEIATWSGEQLSYSLRNIPTLAMTPIVLLIPETLDPLRLIRAQLLGVTSFLAQPITEKNLLKILHQYSQ